MTSLDRRAFLGSLPLVSLAACEAARSDAGESPERVPVFGEFGVQLYTLRSVIPSDVDVTLTALAAMGYASVEFAGLYDRSPAEMRTALDRAGLRAASSHHSLTEVREVWPETLEGAQELGQDLVVVPSLPGEVRTADGLRQVADWFNGAGELAREAGLRFGYHNHEWELRPLESGEMPMSLLLEHTDPALVDWQMDIYWTVHGGADPLVWLDRHRERVTSVHVKDRTADGLMVDVGDGVIDFGTILPAAADRGLLHAFVEHDQPDGALRSVERSLRHLMSLEGRAAPGGAG